MYVITGKDRSGKRFTPIHTTTPQHYNIWKGSIWEYDEWISNKGVTYHSKRRLVKRINN
jgi:hypothetical protein